MEFKQSYKSLCVKIMTIACTIGTFILLAPSNAHASCDLQNKGCVMQEILDTASSIENPAWRDKVLRELAKSYTHEGKEDQALPLISQIQKADTKAMAIRGIGIAAADNNWKDAPRYATLFTALTKEAQKIDHLPSQGIAYTYIAMAQAFAKDDAGAMKTAKSMQNQALRNKAFGESAEIQAERGDYVAATESIQQIDSLAFRNKAYGLVAKILTQKGQLQDAYKAAQKIDNAYGKSQALQNIVNFGNKEETLTDNPRATH